MERLTYWCDDGQGGGELRSDSYDVTLFKMSFCPKCGSPLTDAAWAELEKKIRGCVE